MSDSIADLERQLIQRPFDAELRSAYAGALQEGGRLEDALQQWRLLVDSNAVDPGHRVALARCELASGNTTGALGEYLKARNLPDFEPDDELEKLVHASQARGPELNVVAGGKAKVTSIERAVPDKVRFSDVVGMERLKKTLRLQIVEPFRNPGLFQKFRKKSGGGVMLYGPPGCGKTLMARAIAGECNAEFQIVGISDVLNMWIGESERNLAAIFEKARASRPCVLFFDELDALAYSRSKASSSAARTIVNEFLAQLDGFSANNEGILTLSATNMPWDVDPAMLRPGRFSRQVFVPPPDVEARKAMLEMRLAGIPADDIDARAIAAATEFYSGADIDGLFDLAKESVIADILESGADRNLATADFMQALDEISPSTIDWLKTARNLVKFSGADGSYKDVERYLRQVGKL